LHHILGFRHFSGREALNENVISAVFSFIRVSMSNDTYAQHIVRLEVILCSCAFELGLFKLGIFKRHVHKGDVIAIEILKLRGDSNTQQQSGLPTASLHLPHPCALILTGCWCRRYRLLSSELAESKGQRGHWVLIGSRTDDGHGNRSS
jgi:hypothetical protein